MLLVGERKEVDPELDFEVSSSWLSEGDLLRKALQIGGVRETAEGESLDVLDGEGRGEARKVSEREVSVVSFGFSEKLPKKNRATE